jgi:DUF2948 family protein
MTRPAQPLRLLAQDADDLAVIAAALQDAIGKVGDIRFDPADHTLTMALNRFRWEAEGEARHERIRAALQMGSVVSVQARKVRREPRDAVVELLTVAFEAGEPPGGAVLLTFAGGGDIRVEVECLDVALADVSAPWPSRHAPQHDLAEG